MPLWRRLSFILVALVGGMVLVGALMFTLPRLQAPAPTATLLVPIYFAPTPTPSPTEAPQGPVVAVVNNDPISQDEWLKATALDQAMNELAKQPPTTAEATLDRLINERLVLEAAQAQKAPLSGDEAQALARVAALQHAWGADDATLDRALASAGLTRPIFVAEIQRLLAVEAYLKQVSATQDATQWLAAQRARAHVSLYVDLASAAVEVSALPTATPTASALPAAASPTAAAATTLTTSALPVGSSEGQLAPDFTLNTSEGKTVKLSRLRGQPVVINFWATWCAICRGELPALESAYTTYHDQGVTLLGVDVREDAATVQPFAAQNGMTFPLPLDADGAVSDLYQVRGIPTTLFVDASGVVRVRHLGPLTPEQFAALVEPLIITSTAPANAPTPPETPSAAKSAPDFSLARENGAQVHLSDYRNKENVVLVFYRGQT
jgi:peroxiredoxin